MGLFEGRTVFGGRDGLGRYMMNIERIDEPIRVLATFSNGQARPVRFRWGRRTYPIQEINGRWTDRGEGDSAGVAPRLCYSVQSGDETYYLHFDTHDVQWWLEQVITQ